MSAKGSSEILGVGFAYLRLFVYAYLITLFFVLIPSDKAGSAAFYLFLAQRISFIVCGVMALNALFFITTSRGHRT